MSQAIRVVPAVDDFIAQYREAKQYIERFVLWPRRWKEYASAHGGATLVWSAVPFSEAHKATVPDTPGVYTFSIEPHIAAHPGASFLMYVGKTENQTLRVRFGQYLRERNDPKGRPHMHV